MNIVLIGPPGCGKSSVARGYADKSRDAYTHISSGDIARHLAECDEIADAALKQGHYAPEAAMRAEIKARIEGAIFDGKSVILDGFPRLLAQVVVLEEALKKPPLYVELICPQYVCMQRAIKRGREHDQPDAIASRFEAFEKDTKPVLKLLHSGGEIITIENHTRPVDEAIAQLLVVTDQA